MIVNKREPKKKKKFTQRRGEHWFGSDIFGLLVFRVENNFARNNQTKIRFGFEMIYFGSSV